MPSVNPGPAITSTPNTDAVLSPVNTLSNPVTQGANAFRLLAIAKAANVNALGDTAMPVINANSYSVFQIVLTNASISLTTAAAGVFTAAAAGGTAIKANAALATNTGPTVVIQATVAATAVQTAQTLYVNVGTAQGAPATVDVYVYGYDLS